MAADYCSLPMNLMELMALMQMKSMAFSGGAYLHLCSKSVCQLFYVRCLWTTHKNYTNTRTKTTTGGEKSNVAQCVLTTRTNNTRAGWPKIYCWVHGKKLVSQS